MSAVDFWIVRSGLSEQDLVAFASLAQIEKLQAELVAALEGLRDEHCGDVIGALQTRHIDAVLAKARGKQP